MTLHQEEKIKKNTIVVVGAGFLGIHAAKMALDAGFEVLILEKKDSIGGVWRDFANCSSRVQVVAPVYHFEIPGKDVNSTITDFTPKNEILENAKEYFLYYGLDKRTIFNAEVTEVKKYSHNKVRVRYHKDNQSYELLVDAVMLLPGGLARPRSITYLDEECFQGQIAQGISDDLKPSDFSDKDVLIIGFGAFAVENARTALENGAKSITLLCNSFNIVFSQFANFRLESIFYSNVIGNISVIHASADLVGCHQLNAKILDDYRLVQTAIHPVSDIFFLAIYYDKLKIYRDQIGQFVQDGVVTKKGKKIKADIVLKCLGFLPNEQIENASDFNYLQGSFINGENRILFFGDFPLGYKGIWHFLSANAFTTANMFFDIFFYFLRHPEKYRKAKNKIGASDTLSPSILTYYVSNFLKPLALSDFNILSLILYRKGETTEKVNRRYSSEEFIRINKEKWQAMCQRFASQSDKKDILPYPFKSEKTNLFTKILTKLAISFFRRRFNKMELYKFRLSNDSICDVNSFMTINPVKESLISAYNINLYCNERGSGEPILMIHGLYQTSFMWTYLAEILSKKYRVITFDLRGLGRSFQCEKSFDVTAVLNDIKLIIDSYDIKNVTLIGNGVGGCIAQSFALKFPQIIRALICMSTLPLYSKELDKLFKISFLPKGFPCREKIAKYFKNYILNKTIGLSKVTPNKTEFLDEYSANLKDRETFDSFLIHAKVNYSKSKEETKNCIHTLWYQGDEDAILPRLDQIDFSPFHNIETYTLKGCTHSLVEECPEILAEKIQHFMENHISYQ